MGKLVWVDTTDRNSSPSPTTIMARITSNFLTSQINAVKKVSTADEVLSECPQNFNGFSECYAALIFYDIPRDNASAPIKYTIMGDSGLCRIDVKHHEGDYERRIMPLQWALDQVIMEMKSGTNVSTPLEWGFTTATNAQRDEAVRTKYIRGITQIIIIAFFVSFLGIAYHLTGAMAGERASQLMSHMKAMGLLNSARIMSAHIFFALIYLPSWVIMAFAMAFQDLDTHQHRWSMFIAAPFGKTPQLAAVASTFFSILTAVLAIVLPIQGTIQATVFTCVFQPTFYVFAIRAINGFEHNGLITNPVLPDPDNHLNLIAFIIAGIINIFLREVTAISDLSLDIPKQGIFVLLGSNGAGKSTFLSILGGLTSPSRGVMIFEGGTSTPPRGILGIVPQKNILINELSPLQTLRLFSAIKWSMNSPAGEDLEQLLRDCDLQNKVHSPASTLSGGQKRKLQLAIGLVEGSKLVLVDEATSGHATLVLTTHLLDEASLLADHISIICAPGKLVASGSPVALKREMGNGYTVQLSIRTPGPLEGLLHELHAIVPDVQMSLDIPHRPLLHLGSKDPHIVGRVLGHLDTQSAKYEIVSYDVLGTTIEDIFLDVMAKNQVDAVIEEDSTPVHAVAPAASVNASNFTDAATFTQYIDENYASIPIGGVSFDLAAGSSMFAWEGTGTQWAGIVLLNLVSNIMFNRALNVTGKAGSSPTLIQPIYQRFPLFDDKTFGVLEWLVPFCAAMAVFPAFLALYVAKERESSVKTMQLSNGLNPVGLWLGHLLFDSIPTFIMATLVVILFAVLTDKFFGLGILWLILVLHGITGTLLAYCMTLVVVSPLSAFAATAAYQIIMFMLYLAGYLLTYTYANPAYANGMVKAIHFTLSFLSPVASVTRAGIVSVNLFSLLCDGGDSEHVSSSTMIGIDHYGGPILYLILQSIALFTLLFWVDSGSVLFQRLRRAHEELTAPEPELPFKEDIDLEAAAASSPNNLLQVLDATKRYGTNTAVDRLSFGVAPGTVFCMVGPNGAGKTTSINMMSGNIVPDRGDVLINKASIVKDLWKARISLGVCPQFSAIDAQLSVREHLTIYSRLKGLNGQELDSSIDSLLVTTGLHLYSDRLAGKLSGGNQRKLSLATALIGNPPVILIDEFSTGIDAKIKREMWQLLRTVATSKAFVITTHSMEEAAALATKVGILAVRLLGE
ncbi:ABC transporter A family member 2 [Mycena venus]|uniref:ABC transporter A family member 2 n=1 Tax=Mycena venus TaxID=2733690 RepID=A0A8H6Y585_9AGAR|nr:ABC transporter A family member 2 [Mycena venus]